MASNGSEEEVKKHDEDLLHHYDQVATRYNQAWFYQDGSPYQTWLADAISVSRYFHFLFQGVINALQAHLPTMKYIQLRLQAFPTSRVVDLGAGKSRCCCRRHSILLFAVLTTVPCTH